MAGTDRSVGELALTLNASAGSSGCTSSERGPSHMAYERGVCCRKPKGLRLKK